MAEKESQTKLFVETMKVWDKISHLREPKEVRERLQNNLIFSGIVNEAITCGLSPEGIAGVIDEHIKQGSVVRPGDCVPGIESVSAALCALELEELEVADMEFLLRLRLN